MNLIQDLENMQRHESFARIVREIEEMREDSLKELAGAETHMLQQIAGKVVAYDDILVLLGAKTLRKRFPNI